MQIRLEDQIGTIVADDYRTAAVFKAKGIDFCCRGHRSLKEVIQEKGLVTEDVLRELDSIACVPGSVPADYSKWKLEYLIEHLITYHHVYVRQQIPVITEYLDHVFRVHGKTQVVLGEIRSLFSEHAKDLLKHMDEEEELVFPMIRDLAITPLHTDSPSCVPLSFFRQMLNTMVEEHTQEGDRWKKISDLTHQFTQPVGCNTMHVTINLLKEFYENLQLHIHIENNILFPGALDLKNKKTEALKS